MTPQEWTESRVVAAFTEWLISESWTIVKPTDRWTDIEAVRGPERLICEAKGFTKEHGTDADIAYGQLLRRMTDPAPGIRYAYVVPTSGLLAALRVPQWVRDLIRVVVYEVREDGSVARH